LRGRRGGPTGSAPASSSSRATVARPSARAGSSWCQRDEQATWSADQPVRGSGRVERAGSALQLGTDAVGVAENDGRHEGVVGDGGRLFEHAGGSTDVGANARLAELVGLLGQVEGSRVHLLLQSRPAREPVFAGQRELGGC